jgi:PAS domain S-box-containing protein
VVRWTRVHVLVAAAGICVVCIDEAWLLLRIGGTQATATVDGLAVLSAAVTAMTCAASGARRSHERSTRLGWSLMSGSMLLFVVGIVISMLYVVVAGQRYPFPSLADIPYLSSGVLEVAAVIFLAGPGLTSGRLRVLLDGGIVAASVLATSWVTAMRSIYEAGGAGHLTTAVALAYPASNTVQIGIVLSALANVRRLNRALLLVGLGMLAFAVSATIYAQQGNTHPNALDVGDVLGCFLIALGATTVEASGAAGDEMVPAGWRVGLPYLPVLLVAAVLTLAQRTAPLDLFTQALVAVLAPLVVTRQVAAVVESQTLAVRLARTSAEQQVLIEQAPVGICRLDAVGRILSTNIALETMLGHPTQWFAGRQLEEFMRGDDRARVPLAGEGAGAEPRAVQVHAVRPDGSTVWCSATVGPLRGADGQIDRAVAIIEDISDRKRQALMAANVQRRLLPREAPDIAGYRLAAVCLPAEDVAGDFFDWRVTGAGILHLTVADVMGKGMGAALVTAVLRTAFRSAPPDLEPAERVRLAADAIEPDLSGDGLFATLVHAQLDAPTGELRYVDAGHGYCRIRRVDGELTPLDCRSLPVGVQEDGTFDQGSDRLAPGDALVVYSDGLVERSDGSAALCDLLPSAPGPIAAAALMQQLLAEMPGGATDDVTVVVLERVAG